MVFARSIGAAAALLAVAACGGPPRDPMFDAPLVQWRTTGTQSRILDLPDGRRLRLPVGEAACGWPPGDAPQWTICTLDWSRNTGRLIGYDIGHDPQRVSTSYYFDPGAAPSTRRMARAEPDQWAPEPDVAWPPDPNKGTGPVRGRLEGRIQGRSYWVGCWETSYRYPFPYGCYGAIDLGSGDSALIEFETGRPPGAAPYMLDRRRVEVIMRYVVAVRATFSEPASGAPVPAPSPAR